MVRLVLLLFLGLAASQIAQAQTAPEIVRDCPTCPEMVRIKAGSFMMGVSEAESAQFKTNDDSRPRHPVTFARDFWLGRFPVTREEFAEFVTAVNYQAGGIVLVYLPIRKPSPGVHPDSAKRSAIPWCVST